MGMINATVRNVEVVAAGLKDSTNGVIKAAFLGVIAALVRVHEDSVKIISADDHTLKQLAAMGHPYGHKHPQIIHSPDETVHIQSGDYIAALKVQKPSSYADREIIEGHVGIMGDAEQEKVDRWLQLGTPAMRARPWAERLIDDHGDEYAEIVETSIAAQMESEG
jgi:hypothetical protein